MPKGCSILLGAFEHHPHVGGSCRLIFAFFSPFYYDLDLLQLSFKSLSFPSKCRLEYMQKKLPLSSSILMQHQTCPNHKESLFFYQQDESCSNRAISDLFSVPVAFQCSTVYRPSLYDELSTLSPYELQQLWTHRGCLPNSYHHEFLVC